MSAAALLATMSFTAVSCGDDDDNNFVTCPTPDKVFTNGMPTEIDGATFVKDAQGRVTAIKEGTETVSFDYTPVSRATNYDMTMTISDTDYPDEKTVFFIQLNEMGFIKYALEVYSDKDGDDPDTDTWEFKYNSDGQMVYMARSENEDDVYMTYKNGDLVEVKEVERADKSFKTFTISYTSDKVKTAIANKGSIMLFDNTFSIDMDEMDVAYYAGLLGRATKNLPVKNVDSRDNSVEEYTWTLNANQYPTKVTGQYYNPDGTAYPYQDVLGEFKW